MIPKDFASIQMGDIEALVKERTRESKTLDYKRELPRPLDEDKREFLADISSFANSSGGDIIYGVEEALDENGKKTGEPKRVAPITGFTADEVKLRLEQSIQFGIEPRLRVHMKEIQGWGKDGSGYVFLIRVPNSFAGPHLVTFKNSSRFYARNSAGKYQLDYAQIRSSFLSGESRGLRIRDFIRERVAKIQADETPLALQTPKRIVMHLIPIAFFLEGGRLQLPDERQMIERFSPHGLSQWCYGLDGFILSCGSLDKAAAYSLLMFNGCVEMVRADAAHDRDEVPWLDDILTFTGYVDRLFSCLRGLEKMDTSPSLPSARGNTWVCRLHSSYRLLISS